MQVPRLRFLRSLRSGRQEWIKGLYGAADLFKVDVSQVSAEKA